MGRSRYKRSNYRRSSGRRYSSHKKNDASLGCLLAIFQLIGSVLLLLFTSKDPTAKKIGWGILGILGVIYISSTMETPVEGVLIIVGIAVAIVAIINSVIEKEMLGKEKGFTNNLKSSERIQQVEMAVKKEIPEFDKQLDVMRKHVQAIHEETTLEQNNGITKNSNMIIPDINKISGYYKSVQEALDDRAISPIYEKIMIYKIENTKIKECPGLVWFDENNLYVFPMKKESDIYEWSLAEIPMIYYEKIREIDITSFYQDMNTEPIADEFEEIMPQCLFDNKGTYTDVFILPIGLQVSNTSGKILAKLLQTEFRVMDEITQSVKYVKEIKELYESYILRENEMMSYEEYADKRQLLINSYKEREKNLERLHVQMEEAKRLKLLD